MLLGKEEVDVDYLENTAKYEIFSQPQEPFYKGTKGRRPFHRYHLISIKTERDLYQTKAVF